MKNVFIKVKNNILKLLFLLLLIPINGCSSKKSIQTEFISYTRQDLNLIAEQKFGFDLTKIKLCEFFIINGEVYDLIGIDTILHDYDKKELEITIFAPSENSTWFHHECDLITLITTKKG